MSTSRSLIYALICSIILTALIVAPIIFSGENKDVIWLIGGICFGMDFTVVFAVFQLVGDKPRKNKERKGKP